MTDLNRRRLMTLTGALAASAALPGVAFADVVEADWSADVEVLDAAWTALHPGLLRYQTRAELDGRFEALRRAWRAPATFRQRLLDLTRVTASVRCGHSYPSPYNASDAVRAQMYPDRSLVPFAFRWLGLKMVVTQDRTGQNLFQPGDVIETIDGVTTESLLLQLVPLARADGSNDAKRVSLMEMRGDDGYETFDLHLPLILPLKERAVFGLSNGRRIEAALLTVAERRAALPETVDDPVGNPWTIETGQDGIARLTMPGWALYNSSFDWAGWLGGVMDDLTGDGARGLIVDLRGNEGGLDCGDVIVSRLIERDLEAGGMRQATRYRRVPDALRPHLSTWDQSFYDLGRLVSDPDEDGFHWRVDGGGEAATIRPLGRRFTGPVRVLCDASNSSATFGFAAKIRRSGTGLLVGQTTGGNLRGINGGAFFFMTLPASRIEIDLPLIAGFPTTPQPDAGIEPDLAVPTTADDVRAGRDPQMAAAVASILST